MSPKNGKHKEHGHIFKISAPYNQYITECIEQGCDHTINLILRDHIIYRERKCKDGHQFLVWHNPETKTYMVSCA